MLNIYVTENMTARETETIDLKDKEIPQRQENLVITGVTKCGQ